MAIRHEAELRVFQTDTKTGRKELFHIRFEFNPKTLSENITARSNMGQMLAGWVGVSSDVMQNPSPEFKPCLDPPSVASDLRQLASHIEGNQLVCTDISRYKLSRPVLLDGFVSDTVESVTFSLVSKDG